MSTPPICEGARRCAGADARAVDRGRANPRAEILSLCAGLLFGFGCGGPGLPRRSSPTPTPQAEQPGAIGAVDTRDPRLAWYDVGSQRVLSFRGGHIVPVQDRVFPDAPTELRVLPDDTVVMAVGQELRIQPTSGEARSASLPQYAALQSFDGTSQDAVWLVLWAADLRLCRVDGNSTHCVATLPDRVGGIDSPFHVAVTAEGSVYVNNGDGILFRWIDERLRRVGNLPGGYVRTLRAGSAAVLATTFSGVFVVEGDAIRPVSSDEFASDAVGTPDDFVMSSNRIESRTGTCLSGHCGSEELWRQQVWTRVRPSGAVELGHEDCDLDDQASTVGCSRTTGALGLDGDRVTILGRPLRTLAR